MTVEEIKAAIMRLDDRDRQRLVLEVLQALWPQLARDDSCVQLLRKLVDEESVKEYREEHMDNI